MSKARSEPMVERVAQAIYEAGRPTLPWDAGSATSKERSREYARNAMRLLDDDIGVLLAALNEAAPDLALRAREV